MIHLKVRMKDSTSDFSKSKEINTHTDIHTNLLNKNK